jgi:hypothetical protein
VDFTRWTDIQTYDNAGWKVGNILILFDGFVEEENIRYIYNLIFSKMFCSVWGTGTLQWT